ncbi:MAG TPA: hypothetical protein ENK44_06235 [Caldithrix abyssi]|uniref:Uncharacterized protein n=1 Tax=Caldithrix abyssi TaxID=187145 RepID=A0A7V4WVE4_CALAY|nr:hypothetical protein [Caldithrix abyssi]
MKLKISLLVIIGLVLLYYSLTPEFNVNFPYANIVLPILHIILLIIILILSGFVGKWFWIIVSFYISVFSIVYSAYTQSTSEKMNPDIINTIFPSDQIVIADWQDNIIIFYWVYTMFFGFYLMIYSESLKDKT